MLSSWNSRTLIQLNRPLTFCMDTINRGKSHNRRLIRPMRLYNISWMSVLCRVASFGIIMGVQSGAQSLAHLLFGLKSSPKSDEAAPGNEVSATLTRHSHFFLYQDEGASGHALLCQKAMILIHILLAMLRSSIKYSM